MNSIELTGNFLTYFIRYKRERKFIAKHLLPVFNNFYNELGLTFSKEEQKRITVYYPALTVIAGAENFLLLRKRKLTHAERYRLTVVSAMSAICDDLIDEEGWTAEELWELINNLGKQETDNKRAAMIHELHNHLLNTYPPPPAYLPALKTAIESQVASLRQMDPTITRDEIINVSKNKNGNTSLMFASLINEEWTQQEKDIIFYSGYIGQLVNDTFDVYKDVTAGVQTYINHCESAGKARNFFLAEWQLFVDFIYSSSASRKQKRKLQNRFACIHSYALVAFHKLMEIDQHAILPISWQAVARKYLVTDMELFQNRIRLFTGALRLSKTKPTSPSPS
jgi:hypothetical protein